MRRVCTFYVRLTLVRGLQDEIRRLLAPSWSIAQIIKVVKMDGKNKAIVKVSNSFRVLLLSRTE